MQGLDVTPLSGDMTGDGQAVQRGQKQGQLATFTSQLHDSIGT